MITLFEETQSAKPSIATRIVTAQALQEAQVDEGVDQGILVGDGGAIAEMRPFDAEGERLGVDALVGGPLAIE